MATTWTETYIYYQVISSGDGSASVQLAIQFGPQPEADIDTAVQAFADAYNSLHPNITVSKSYDGTGVSDWTYTAS